MDYFYSSKFSRVLQILVVLSFPLRAPDVRTAGDSRFVPLPGFIWESGSRLFPLFTIRFIIHSFDHGIHSTKYCSTSSAVRYVSLLKRTLFHWLTRWFLEPTVRP